MKTINLPVFWQFSLALYKNQPVQSVLIEYQDSLNANVNLALLCAMLNQHKITLSQNELRNLHCQVADFSNIYTKPLRALRLSYKHKHKQSDIKDYQAIRQKLLDAELMFEQQEQDLLITSLPHLSSRTTDVINGHLLAQEHDNLYLYQSYLSQNNKPLFPIKGNLTDLNQYLV